MSALVRQLADLAAEISREHERCQDSYRTALDHARKVGELLSEAKARLAHGEWGPWLAGHVEFSDRTARAYMQLAADPELLKRQSVAELGVRDALDAIAKPAARAPSLDLRTTLRGVDRAEAEAALAELGEMPEASTFPLSAMERTTWRQIREALSRVARAMDEGSADGLSGWSRREALHEASRHAREASGLLSELGSSITE